MEKYCDKVKELESKIKTLEDKVFKMNLNQKKNKCIIKTGREPEEITTLREVAKMFKRGWVCKDERCVMWVPHHPKGYPLWNKQKDGVELDVKVISDFWDDLHEHPARYVNCKTGKEFCKIYLKDVEFHYYHNGEQTIPADQIEYLYHKFSCLNVQVTIQGDDTLLDDETLRHLAYELNVTNNWWSAEIGKHPGTLVLTTKR